MFLRSPWGRPENFLGRSRINIPGTSLGGQIWMSPGRHLNIFLGGQIRTSLGWSNRILRGRPGDVWGGVSSGRPEDQYLPAGKFSIFFPTPSCIHFFSFFWICGLIAPHLMFHFTSWYILRNYWARLMEL